MARIPRHEILSRLRAKIARGAPIIGGGAGTGLSAKCEEAGGIDLIVIYNSGRYRMAGRGSLAGLMAYGNANEIVVEMAREVLPVVSPRWQTMMSAPASAIASALASPNT
jgi:predicted TIM-barrel enzyme